jgi:ParB family transcriptional regulator, chromosome partitioning protein
MSTVVSVNPFRVRMWELHDRLDEHISEKSCRREIESFLKHGQLIPAIGRPLPQDEKHDVELICGARRLFVARHVNRPLLVDLRSLSDREAILAMDIENRQRADISAYERGISYARWLRQGHFQSQDELARVFRLSASQVSRLLRLARLPTAIIDAFGSPVEICEGWGLDLLDALDDPMRRQRTLRRARLIADQVPRPPGRAVYRQLISASGVIVRSRVRVHDKVITDSSGKPLFRIREQRKAVAVLLPSDRVSNQALQVICELVADILEPKRLGELGNLGGEPNGDQTTRSSTS